MPDPCPTPGPPTASTEPTHRPKQTISWPVPEDRFALTLSERLTPARRRLLLADRTSARSGVNLGLAWRIWTADLLLGAVPDFPEGVLAAVQWALPADLTELPSAALTLSILDGWMVVVSGKPGGFDLMEALPNPRWAAGVDNWLVLRGYNLTQLFREKASELLSCLTTAPPESGPNPTGSPPR